MAVMRRPGHNSPVEKLTRTIDFSKHKRLVEIGAKFLKSKMGCRFVLKEFVAAYCRENPDVIGWTGSRSFVVECKTSRQDFKNDSKKIFRNPKYKHLAMGNFIYYMCPVGLIKPNELPKGFGLIYVFDNDKYKVIDGYFKEKYTEKIRGCKVSRQYYHTMGGFYFNANLEDERLLMISALNRDPEELKKWKH